MKVARLPEGRDVLNPKWVEYVQNVGLVIGKPPTVYVTGVSTTEREVRQRREGKNKK